jgi:thiopurine S-methyltransferase
MDKQFWLNKWQENQIHFHQQQIHPLLKKYITSVVKEPTCNVLVPLCGKSLDMTWLVNRGHTVIGSELSKLAIDQYWKEHSLTPTTNNKSDYISTISGNLSLLCGDFFALKKEDIESINGPIDLIYDRAALIALPLEMRIKYYQQMIEISSEQTSWLLIILGYDDKLVNGPPFNIRTEELEEHLSSHFLIELLEENSTEPLGGKFKEARILEMKQKVYSIKKTQSIKEKLWV